MNLWGGWLGGTALLAAGLALHLPLLYRPFGIADFNAGMSFGVFARNFAKHGFTTLRGVPIGPQVVDDVALAMPYVNHPPGGFWLFAAAGTAEWQKRLLTVVAHIACAILLALLLRQSLGGVRAWLAGLALLPLPILVVDCQVSWELLLWCCGLLLLLADQKLQASRARARALWTGVMVVVSAVGPWIDWQYGFLCLALLAPAWQRSWRATLQRVALPWGVSLGSVVLVLAWRAWAMQAPALASAPGGPDAATLAAQAIGERPALRELGAASFAALGEGYTWLVLVAAVPGLWALRRACPRLGLALLVAGLANPLLFASYTIREMHYLGSLAPWLAACAGALGGPARWRVCLTVGLLALVVLPSALDRAQRSDTSFFADLGQVVNSATADRQEDGSERRFAVATTFHACYGYYLEGDWVWPFPVREPLALAA